MLNSTSLSPSYFILGAYLDIGTYIKHLCFVILAVLYSTILLVNMLLIVVICVNRSLHEPMYMFLCSLFVNELYGSSGLFPFLLVQILSDVHTVSVPLCFLQIVCLYSYVKVEFCNLAVMSFDRYVAICRPLQYHTIMTHFKVLILIVLMWLYSFMTFMITLSLTVRLTLCENVLNNVYCLNYQIVKLACSDTRLNYIYGLFGTVLSVLVPLLTILFSYIKILHVCCAGSRQTRQKAASTCAPHLASLLNFSFGCLFEIFQNRFDMVEVPSVLKIIMSLYFAVLQPLLNPVVYGMRVSKIQTACKHFFFLKTNSLSWCKTKPIKIFPCIFNNRINPIVSYFSDSDV